jgi:hypothetical protein
MSLLKTPSWLVEELVGRTVQIGQFTPDVASDAVLWSQIVNLEYVLDMMDIHNIVTSFFGFVSFTIKFTWEIQSSIQHVGLLGAYWYPSDPTHFKFIGYANESILDSFEGKAWYKKSACVELPLNETTTHVQKISWNSVYPCHLTKQYFDVRKGFSPPIGTAILAPIVPLTIGAGGMANASIVLLMSIDNFVLSGYTYKDPNTEDS